MLGKLSNIKKISEYYFEYGKYPSQHSEDISIQRLGKFLMQEKILMRSEDYPKWKLEIIKKYISDFSYDTKSNKVFEQFLYNIKLFKKKYGHVDIKSRDIIANNYHIGAILWTIKRKYKNGGLEEGKIKQLEKMGVCLEGKFEKKFSENMKLAKCAADEGIRISKGNTNYEKENLYIWIFNNVKSKYINNDLTDEEIEIIEKLVGKPLYKLFHRGSFVKMFDVIEKREICIYNSQKELADSINLSRSAINLYLKGKITTPYKGRFMFYYATDEEVKKYLEDSKVS